MLDRDRGSIVDEDDQMQQAITFDREARRTNICTIRQRMFLTETVPQDVTSAFTALQNTEDEQLPQKIDALRKKHGDSWLETMTVELALFGEESPVAEESTEIHIYRLFDRILHAYSEQHKSYPLNAEVIVQTAHRLLNVQKVGPKIGETNQIPEDYITELWPGCFYIAQQRFSSLTNQIMEQNTRYKKPQNAKVIEHYARKLAVYEPKWLIVLHKIASMDTWNPEQLVVAMTLKEKETGIGRLAKDELINRLADTGTAKTDQDKLRRQELVLHILSTPYSEWTVGNRSGITWQIKTLIEERPELFQQDIQALQRCLVFSYDEPTTKDGNSSQAWSQAFIAVLQSFPTQYRPALQEMFRHDLTHVAEKTLEKFYDWSAGINDGRWGGDILVREGWLALLLYLHDEWNISLSDDPKLIELIRNQYQQDRVAEEEWFGNLKKSVKELARNNGETG